MNKQKLMYIKYNTDEKEPDFEHKITAFMKENGYEPSTDQHRQYQTNPTWKGYMTHMIFTLIDEDKDEEV